jgi:hypothetical protein
MDAATKLKLQRYEQTRIVNLMSDIEDACGSMFHVKFPDLQDYYETEIAEHTETRAKISRFRCELENTLKALQA